MAISLTTTEKDSSRIVEIECDINDYMHTRRDLDTYIRTGLRMRPDAVHITIKKGNEENE